jgi:hypothetical protein
MKKRLTVVAASAVAMLGGWILGGPSWGQHASPRVVAQPPPEVVPTIVRDPATGPSSYSLGIPHDTSTQSEIGQLIKQLREADEDAKKTEITKQLEAAVTKYFDEDLKGREDELAKLEERLQKLNAQLDRRRKAKGEIIELQMKVLINEAEGLGFAGPSFFEPAASPALLFRGMVGGGALPAQPRPSPNTRALPSRK